jgi:acetyltransferase-like isoleucine patch superfamily enzyme
VASQPHDGPPPAPSPPRSPRLASRRAIVRGLRTTLLKLRRRIDVHGTAHIARGVRITVAPGARVILEDGCALGERCRIEANAGTVRIGPGARIGERAVLVARAGIDVGAGCEVGDWAVIADTEPAFADEAAPVTLGDGARIGLHAAVVAGAIIAPGEVVGAYETRAPRRSA